MIRRTIGVLVWNDGVGYTPVKSTQARAERLSYYGPGISLEEGSFGNVESNLSSEEPDVEVKLKTRKLWICDHLHPL